MRSAASMWVSRAKSTSAVSDSTLTSSAGCAARKSPSRGTSQAAATDGVTLIASTSSRRGA
jgi:hypothetical protein